MQVAIYNNSTCTAYRHSHVKMRVTIYNFYIHRTCTVYIHSDIKMQVDICDRNCTTKLISKQLRLCLHWLVPWTIIHCMSSLILKQFLQHKYTDIWNSYEKYQFNISNNLPYRQELHGLFI